MTGAAQNSSKSRWKSASVSGRSSDSGMKGSGGMGIACPSILSIVSIFTSFLGCVKGLYGAFL